MNTLHDTLADRAEAVSDTAHHERVAAVRRRITAARRRRTAAIATAAAAVVAIAGVAVSLPRHHGVQPADAPSNMVGHDVPSLVHTSLDATYDYTKGYVGHDGKLNVTLPASETGYMVWMTSRSDAGRLVLHSGGDRVWTSAAGAFGDTGFYQVAPGDPTHLTVTQTGADDPGDVALAVYAFAKPGPDWYVHDGVMFPGQIAGRSLLGAKVGAKGQRSVTVHAASGATHADFYLYCEGLPHGVSLAVSIRGEAGYTSQGGGCEEAHSASIAAPDNSSTGQKVSTDGFEATVQAQDAHGNPVDIPAGARIGLGIYPTAKTHQGLQQTIDTAGHRWTLEHVTTGTVGQRRMSTTIDGTSPTLVAFGSRAGTKARVITWVGGDEQVTNQGGGIGQTVVADGRRDTVIRQRFAGPAGTGRLFVATYVLSE